MHGQIRMDERLSAENGTGKVQKNRYDAKKMD